MKTNYIQGFAFCLLLFVTINSSAQLSPLTISTINANDSVVIYYDVTINSGAGTQVSNQGTVTATGGISLLTDDPDTGLPNDPTITPLNMFPLPVSLYTLGAVQKGDGVEVAWTVAAESNMLKYEVERSTDGRRFEKIGEVAAQNSGQTFRYTFLDLTAGSGVNYYRLKMKEHSAADRYSMTVRVDLAGKGGSVTVFPNPAQQKQITLQLSNMAKGNYQLELYNSAGQPVYSKSIVHEGGSLNRGFTLPSGLAQGMYFVQVRNERSVYTQPLMVK